YAGGVEDRRLETMRKFAELLGLCFQIRDDIFDYFPDQQSTIGKPTGNDLREGKVTLPLLHVLCREDLPAHAEMLALSRHEQLTADEVDTLMEYAVANGGIDYARATMTRLRTEAAAILTTAFPESASRASLLTLLDYVIDRTH
ncbi:MAG: polyprenyl synthetase family protein, partial [Muribaculaceae bacterium]|nr:polyprenyl synthetase family protein [Muribaculaceae bacterium]